MVKLISLAAQDRAIRRFFESPIPNPDGAVVEVNGHRSSTHRPRSPAGTGRAVTPTT